MWQVNRQISPDGVAFTLATGRIVGDNRPMFEWEVGGEQDKAVFFFRSKLI
jgi:hypothetical protein